MTSTRLPGKVLKSVLGKSLLEHQIERLRRAKQVDEIVIATTDLPTDDPIAKLCERLGVACFRGSENNVLSRYYGAALSYQPDAVVRVTSDCPLIDPVVVDQVIHFFKVNFPKYAYVSNIRERTYPRGMDTEVFTFQALSEAFQQATTAYEQEHVTPYITAHPEKYPQGSIAYSHNESGHRWTVDTPEDFILIEKILTHLYPTHPCFSLEDALALLRSNPEWRLINAHIEQKK